MPRSSNTCLFCEIVRGTLPANIVFQNDVALAFLDHRPLFPGHCLLVPKIHHETLADLPKDLIAPLFETSQRLSIAVQSAMQSEGTFVAMNNKVSQSVPHLHIHIVPRKKGDGLKGFFWPRKKYGEGEMDAVAELISRAVSNN